MGEGKASLVPLALALMAALLVDAGASEEVAAGVEAKEEGFDFLAIVLRDRQAGDRFDVAGRRQRGGV